MILADSCGELLSLWTSSATQLGAAFCSKRPTIRASTLQTLVHRPATLQYIFTHPAQFLHFPSSSHRHTGVLISPP
jgi:hypothetical protein